MHLDPEIAFNIQTAAHSLAEARAILKNLALSFNENLALPSAIFKRSDAVRSKRANYG